MKKLSSDDTFMAKYIFPWLFMALFILFLVIILYTKDYSLITLEIPVVLFFVTGKFSDLINLAEVSAVEEDQEFEITTSNHKYRIPFNKLKSARIDFLRTAITLKFTDRKITFLPNTDNFFAPDYSEVISYVKSKISR